MFAIPAVMNASVLLRGVVSPGVSHTRSSGRTCPLIPLSILELGRVREGGTRRDALDEARTLAQHAERLGYTRIWVAEHHNFASVTTAATSVVIAHLAAGTSTIRVGAGGVMLPNHAP